MRAINIDELFKLLSIWLTHHLDSCSLIPLCPPCPLCVSLSVVTVECRIETWDIFPRCRAHNIGVCIQMKLKTHYPQPLCCLPHLACCIHHDSILTLVIGARLMSQVNCYLNSLQLLNLTKPSECPIKTVSLANNLLYSWYCWYFLKTHYKYLGTCLMLHPSKI